jgi:hypothetical protein
MFPSVPGLLFIAKEAKFERPLTQMFMPQCDIVLMTYEVAVNIQIAL